MATLKRGDLTGELIEDMLSNPQAGDSWTEMMINWQIVIHREGDTVVVMRAAAPCTLPDDGEIETFTLDGFRTYLSYGSIPGTWAKPYSRGDNVQGWYKPQAGQPRTE